MLKEIDFAWYRVQMNTSWTFKLVMGVFFFFQSGMCTGVIVAITGTLQVQDGYFLKSLRFPCKIPEFCKWLFLCYTFTLVLRNSLSHLLS